MTDQGRRRASGKARSRTILIILVLVFTIPFAIALAMFKGHYIFGGLLNHGELVEPPFSVSLLDIKDERSELFNKKSSKKKSSVQITHGKWLLLYFNPGLCETDCQQGLANLQRVQKAAGKNGYRVANALLTYPTDLADKVSIDLVLRERYPQIRLFTTEKQSFTHVIRQHVNENYALEAGTIYLIDPRGNVIMTYKPNAKPTGILKDLQRLLKASQIG